MEESGTLIAKRRDPDPIGRPEDLETGLGQVPLAKTGIVARHERHGGSGHQNAAAFSILILQDRGALGHLGGRRDAGDLQGPGVAVGEV